MKIVVVFDGSDDGLEGLKAAAAMLRPGGPHAITAALVGWPPRHSPLWDRAFSKRQILDDLHRAMAEVAATEFERLKKIFEPVGSVQVEYLEGDPPAEIVALIDRLKPELFVAGLTRGANSESVTASAFAILRRTSVPAFLTFGKPVGFEHAP